MGTVARPADVVLALAVSILCACGSAPGGVSGAAAQRRWPAARPASYVSPIAAENALPGEPTWAMGADSNGPLQAYLDRASARAGDVVAVKGSSDVVRPVTWVLYRLGWYGGAGARRVAQGGPAAVGPQPACPIEAGTGMVRCAWATAFEVRLAPELVSGYYAVKLVRDDGWAVFAPLVVVDDRPADLLVQAAVNTWQAYNAWGGESLYADGSGKLPGGLGSRVSFDRPYASLRGLGLLSRYELPFARFLERAGYDVSYTTDLEVAAGGAAHLLRAGAFLSVGHDEYWTGAMRDAAEAARDAGMPLLFFGANAAYWKARYEAPGPGGVPRVLACWKWTAFDPDSDPVSGPERTGRFRDPHIARPENALVGAMYESWLVQRFPLVVADAASWLYDGTGLREGDVLPLVTAAEYDVAVENGYQPPGTRVVARLPLVDAYGIPGVGTTVHYRAPSGALVFDAATIEWPLGVDRGSDVYDPRIERMTANVLREALGLAVPAGVGGAPPDRPVLFTPPHGPSASTVSTAATGLGAISGVAVLADGSLVAATPRAHRVMRVNAAGAVESLAGDGNLSSSQSYDGVPGAQARFYAPTAVLAMPDGSVLVSDTMNDCIRRIAPDGSRTVTTFAGRIGAAGYVDGDAATARFRRPLGLARDPVSGARARRRLRQPRPPRHRRARQRLDARGRAPLRARRAGGDGGVPPSERHRRGARRARVRGGEPVRDREAHRDGPRAHGDHHRGGGSGRGRRPGRHRPDVSTGRRGLGGRAAPRRGRLELPDPGGLPRRRRGRHAGVDVRGHRAARRPRRWRERRDARLPARPRGGARRTGARGRRRERDDPGALAAVSVLLGRGAGRGAVPGTAALAHRVVQNSPDRAGRARRKQRKARRPSIPVGSHHSPHLLRPRRSPHSEGGGAHGEGGEADDRTVLGIEERGGRNVSADGNRRDEIGQRRTELHPWWGPVFP